MTITFDYEKVKFNHERAIDNIQKSIFLQEAAQDVIERLKTLDKVFSNILDIECGGRGLSKLLVQTYKSAKIEVRSAFTIEELVLSASKFDLITFSLGLHWINDIQKFLSNIKHILKADGIFIGNFVGGDSLKNIRKKFIEAEMAAKKPHFQHVAPFIHFDQVAPLFQHAGFIEVIIDYENIQLTFGSPLDFIKMLKNIGESGATHNPTCRYIPKNVYAILQNRTINFIEHINVISFIASPNKNSIKLI